MKATLIAGFLHFLAFDGTRYQLSNPFTIFSTEKNGEILFLYFFRLHDGHCIEMAEVG